MILLKRKQIYLILIFLLLLLLFLLKQIYPLLHLLLNYPNPTQIQQQLQALGFYGLFILFLIQILQSFIFFIPAFPLQIASGISYGFIISLLLLSLSSILANTLLYFLFENDNKFLEYLSKRFTKLFQTQQPNKTIAILYSLPIAPTIVKPYLSQKYKIPYRSFLKISTFASIPSTSLSILIGSCIRYHLYILAIVFAILTALFTLGSSLYLYQQIQKR